MPLEGASGPLAPQRQAGLANPGGKTHIKGLSDRKTFNSTLGWCSRTRRALEPLEDPMEKLARAEAEEHPGGLATTSASLRNTTANSRGNPRTSRSDAREERLLAALAVRIPPDRSLTVAVRW